MPALQLQARHVLKPTPATSWVGASSTTSWRARPFPADPTEFHSDLVGGRHDYTMRRQPGIAGPDGSTHRAPPHGRAAALGYRAHVLADHQPDLENADTDAVLQPRQRT